MADPTCAPEGAKALAVAVVAVVFVPEVDDGGA